MVVDWKWKLALLWRGGVKVQAVLQPYPPADLRNPAVPDKEPDKEKGEPDNG